MKVFIKNTFVLAVFVLSTLVAKAQVKIGSNPTISGPSSNLEVEASTTNRKVKVDKVTGQVTIQDGTEGLNKVLTSDAVGGASWQNSIDATPAGIIVAFAVSTPPTGYLECNGAAVSRTTYAKLFAVIGTAYGIGDGSTTFNLPDLRGVFVRGWSDGASTDNGRVLGSLQTQSVQPLSLSGTTSSNGAHTHAPPAGTGFLLSGTTIGNNGTGYIPPAGGPTSTWGGVGSGGATASAGAHTHTVTVTGGSVETRPVNIALMYIIKY